MLYYSKSSEQEKQEKPVFQPTPVSLPETAALAAALQTAHRQAVMRDTIILQQTLRTQHHLKMHKQKIPMCPDCVSSTPTTKYHYTKDDFQ
jgi:hypothetical protein